MSENWSGIEHNKTVQEQETSIANLMRGNRITVVSEWLLDGSRD